MNAQQVNEIYAAYYADLRDVTNEANPSSYVYFAETVEEVAEQSGHDFDGDFRVHLGSESAPVVAVALDFHNHDWHAIHADATLEQVRRLFEDCNETAAGGGGEVPNSTSDYSQVWECDHAAWQVHISNGTIETSDDYSSDHTELCETVGIDSDDTESWSCEITELDPIHELLRVGDSVVCAGYGCPVYVLRASDVA